MYKSINETKSILAITSNSKANITFSKSTNLKYLKSEFMQHLWNENKKFQHLIIDKKYTVGEK